MILSLFARISNQCLCPENADTNEWIGNNPNPLEFTPPNTIIAMFGDQGLSDDSKNVLRMIKDENASAIIHLGDFDYQCSASMWDEQITSILGETYPYYSVLGNHDALGFFVENGYQDKIKERLIRNGLISKCRGDIGYRYICSFLGISISLNNVGMYDNRSVAFTKSAFELMSSSIWRISGWHKNQRLFQIEKKSDETGYSIYDESRRQGAIIATAHQHCYSRTKLMFDFKSLQYGLDSGNDILNPLIIKGGQTILHSTGTGGDSLRRCAGNREKNPWWASTSCLPALKYGATFCKFNYNGDPTLAYCYFKQINNDGSTTVVDEYYLRSENIASAPAGSIPCNCPITSNASSNNYLLLSLSLLFTITTSFIFF